MDDLINRAKSRRAELAAVVAAGETARPELQRLDEFLAQADELYRELKPAPVSLPHAEANGNGRPHIIAFGRQAEFTADRVDRLLAENGPLHVSKILQRLYAADWPGSGDPRRDYKNIFSNLAAKPRRFVNLGDAIFDRVQNRREPRED